MSQLNFNLPYLCNYCSMVFVSKQEFLTHHPCHQFQQHWNPGPNSQPVSGTAPSPHRSNAPLTGTSSLLGTNNPPFRPSPSSSPYPAPSHIPPFVGNTTMNNSQNVASKLSCTAPPFVPSSGAQHFGRPPSSSYSTSSHIPPLMGNTTMNNSPQVVPMPMCSVPPPLISSSGAQFFRPPTPPTANPTVLSSSSTLSISQPTLSKSNVQVPQLNVQPLMVVFVDSGKNPANMVSQISSKGITVKQQTDKSTQSQTVAKSSSNVSQTKTTKAHQSLTKKVNETLPVSDDQSKKLTSSSASKHSKDSVQATSIQSKPKTVTCARTLTVTSVTQVGDPRKQSKSSTTEKKREQSSAKRSKHDVQVCSTQPNVTPSRPKSSVANSQMPSISKLFELELQHLSRKSVPPAKVHSNQGKLETIVTQRKLDNDSTPTKHGPVCSTPVNEDIDKAPSLGNVSVGQLQHSPLHHKASSFVRKHERKHKPKRKLITDSPKFIPPVSTKQQKSKLKPTSVSALPDFIPIMEVSDKPVQNPTPSSDISSSSVSQSDPAKKAFGVSVSTPDDTSSTSFRPLVSGKVNEADSRNKRKKDIPHNSETSRQQFETSLPPDVTNKSSLSAGSNSESTLKGANDDIRTSKSSSLLNAGSNSVRTKDNSSNPTPLTDVGSTGHVTSSPVAMNVDSSTLPDKTKPLKVPHSQRNTLSKEPQTVEPGSVTDEDVSKRSESSGSVSLPNSAQALLNSELLSSVLQQSLSGLNEPQQSRSTSTEGNQDSSGRDAGVSASRKSNQLASANAGLTMSGAGGTQLSQNCQSFLDKTLSSTLSLLTPVKAFRRIAPRPDITSSSSNNTPSNQITNASNVKASRSVQHSVSDQQLKSSNSSTTVASNTSATEAGGGVNGSSDEDSSMEIQLQESIFRGMEEMLKKTGERVSERSEKVPISPTSTSKEKQTTPLVSPTHQKKIERILGNYYRRQSSDECIVQMSEVVQDASRSDGVPTEGRVQESTVLQPSLSSNVGVSSPVVIMTERQSGSPVVPVATHQVTSEVETTDNVCNWLGCTKPVDKDRLCPEHVKLMKHINTSVSSQPSSATKDAAFHERTNSPLDESVIFFGDIAGAPSSSKDSQVKEQTSETSSNKPPSSPRMAVSSDPTPSNESAVGVQNQSESERQEGKKASVSTYEDPSTNVGSAKDVSNKRRLMRIEDSEPLAKKPRFGGSDVEFVSGISELNDKEQALQEELIEVQRELSSLKASEEEKVKEIDFHMQQEQELQSEVRQVIREIQQVLAEKQTMLSSNDPNTDIVSQMRHLSNKEYELQQKWVEMNKQITEKCAETVGVKKGLKEIKESVEKLYAKQQKLMTAYGGVLKQKQDLIFNQSSVSVSVSVDQSSSLKSADHSQSSLTLTQSLNTSLSKSVSESSEIQSVPFARAHSKITDSEVKGTTSTQMSSPKLAPQSVKHQRNEQPPVSMSEKMPTLTIELSTYRQDETSRSLSPSLLPKHNRPSKLDTRAKSPSKFSSSESVSTDTTPKSSTPTAAAPVVPRLPAKTHGVLPEHTTPNPSAVTPGEVASGNSLVPKSVTFVPHSESVLSIVKHGNSLFTSSYDNTIHLHDSRSGQLLQSLEYHKKTITCLELYETRDKVYLLSGSSDKTIHMYDTQKRKKYAEFNLRMRVMCMCVSGDILFAGLASGFVQLINLQRRCFLNKHSCSAVSISSLCASGKILCSASFDNLVMCWTLQKLESKTDVEKYHISKRKQLKFDKTVLCVLIHGSRVFAACGDNNLYMYNVKTWKRNLCIPHRDAVSVIRVVGTVLVSASFDKLVRCYDLEKMDLLQVYAGFEDKIFSLCVADGYIYTGLMNGSVQATKLDLTVYFTCKWEGCNIRFGVLEHLKEWHIKEHARETRSSSLVCKWEGCPQRGVHVQPESLQQHLVEHVESIIK